MPRQTLLLKSATITEASIEIGDVILRVPGDVPAERAAALVRAQRGVA